MRPELASRGQKAGRDYPAAGLNPGGQPAWRQKNCSGALATVSKRTQTGGLGRLRALADGLPAGWLPESSLAQHDRVRLNGDAGREIAVALRELRDLGWARPASAKIGGQGICRPSARRPAVSDLPSSPDG